MSEYFVTGATGAIGSSLVPILLDDSEPRLTLLLRAASAADLAARMEQLYAFWQIPSGDVARRARICALRGDVTHPDFGLAADDYQRLAAECTHIVHSAGNVRMNLPIADARRSSVVSAQQVIRLARACARLEKVEFVSTVGVGGRTQGTLPEEWLRTARSFHNTYEQAKAEAEDLVQAEVEKGLPLTVHRPSMVVGESGSGRIMHFQVFYHLCEFLSGRRTLGLAPGFGNARLDIVPADYVARVLAWSSTQTSTAGRVLHSCSGPALAIPLEILQERVRQAFVRGGRRVPPVIWLPTAVFTRILSAASVLLPAETRRAIRTLPVFLEYLATDQTFANRRTQELLAPAGHPLPAPDDYLDQVFRYYLTHTSSSAG
ncbi:MAG: SDR family oxidoreductase [Rhodocyclaceae bacterium]|nr:SDR family oxidoreductase [Rhodocyclaceae bacterium]